MAATSRGRQLVQAVRRYGPPLAHAAYRRWQALTPEEKERYRRQVLDYLTRAREMARGYSDRGRSGGGHLPDERARRPRS
jgi:hypothetical protein